MAKRARRWFGVSVVDIASIWFAALCYAALGPVLGSPAEAFAANPFDRPAHPLAVGDPLPDAAYVDQTGKAVHISDFRGRTLIIGFIYTNCSDQCPLLTAKFATLAAELPPQRFELLEVSIDPERDTRPAISAFARGHGVHGSNWRVLTGRADSFDAFATPLGVSVIAGPNGELLHSERTIIAGPDGRIAYVIDAAGWTPAQVAAVSRHVDGLPSNAVTRLDLELAKAVAAVCGGVTPGRSGIRDVVAVIAVFAMFALLAGFAAWRIFGRSA